MPEVLMPAYAANFQCIGPACEDNCCHTWGVVFSKEHMRWLHGHANHAVVQEALDHLTPFGSSQKGAFVMRMQPDGKCPLLDEKGLCRLQAELGPEALTDTCTYFPRIFNEINGVYEMSMTLTCPEVARICLRNREGIDFIVKVVPEIGPLENRFLLRHFANLPPAARYIEKIRAFVLRVLKTRSVGMEYRLLFLGFFLHKVAECTDAAQMPVLISVYEQMFQSEDFSGQFKQMQTNAEFQLQFWSELTKWRAVDIRSSYPGVYFKAFDTFNGTPEHPITPESYASVRSAYDASIGQHDYIVENYMVNEIFRTCLPFSHKLDVWKGYQEIVLRYSLLKLHLIALAAHHGGLDEELLIPAIFAFERGILYGTPYPQHCLQLMEEKGWDHMAEMAALIKG